MRRGRSTGRTPSPRARSQSRAVSRRSRSAVTLPYPTPRAAAAVAAVRVARSLTRTRSVSMRSRSQSTIRVGSKSSGVSQSVAVIGKPLRVSDSLKGLLKMSGPYISTELNSFGIFSASGFQGITVIDHFQTANLNFYIQNAQTLVLPGSITDGILQSDVPANGRKSIKVFVKSLELIYQFTNQTEGDNEVEIYDLVSKVTSNSYTAPNAAWSTGLADNLGPNINLQTNGIGAPWQCPTDVSNFGVFWTLRKKTIVELGPGRTHIHKMSFPVNRVIDTEMLQNNIVVKGLTATTMFVVRGQVVDDSNTSAIGNIGLAPVKVVGIARKKVILQPMLSFPRVNRSTTASSLAVTNGYAVEEGSGVVQNIAVQFA